MKEIKNENKFAFLIHPPELKDVAKKYPFAKFLPGFLLKRVLKILPPLVGSQITGFKFPSGEEINGWIVICPLTAQQMLDYPELAQKRVLQTVQLAEKLGCKLIGLGAFSSIATGGGLYLSDKVKIGLTTGNTFTATMVIDGILKAAQLLHLNPPFLKATIVGGTGDIGSACARVLTEKVKQLIITGRRENKLLHLNEELSKRRKAEIIVATNNETAVREADIVIAAASSPSPILKIEWFKPGSIVCDVGNPKNISYTSDKRDDIFIFSGGLSKPPIRFSLPIDIGLPSSNIIYGCFAEVIILALEKRFENYTLGKGNITPEKIDEIRDLGKKHGFEVSDFYWGDRLIDESIIEKIKEVEVFKRRF